MISHFSNHPLLYALLVGLIGLAAGAALAIAFNARKRPNALDASDLNRRLEDAEGRYETEIAAKEANQAFFANMSHELRTPFQGLLGMMELIGESPLNTEQNEYLKTAQRSAHHLLGVLNDILDVSAMDSGMFSLSPSPMSLRQVLDDARSIMGLEAKGKAVELSLSCDADVPEWVSGDETRVRQILFNLLTNALKFTREGRIAIRIRRSKSLVNGIVMSVQDTGSGMDERTIQQLFTRFFQGDNSRQRRVGGTGLGLEISRNLARMMGGNIHVASQAGVGSTFTVLMHLQACEARAESDLSDLMTTEVDATSATTPKLHFLVAEDHPINAQYLTYLLHSMGHLATVCENGLEALTLAQRQHFDAALLDYHMPELDGLAVTRAIRSGPAPFSALKILLITADVLADTRQQAINAGVDVFLAKPLKKRNLERALLACGLYTPKASAEEKDRQDSGTNPFKVSDYEMPVSVGLPFSDPPTKNVALVDWPALQDLVKVMTHQGLERQLQAVYRPATGTLAVCATAILTGDIAQQRKALHNLKGTMLLLGLEALAAHCATGEASLRVDPSKPLNHQWIEELEALAGKTRDELVIHFQVAAAFLP